MQSVDLVSFVNARLDLYRRRRLGFNRLWMELLHFRNGDHWIRWNDAGGLRRVGGYEPQAFKYKFPKPVTNYLRASGDFLSSVISRVEPNFLFMPATNDESDSRAAEASRKAMSVLSDENRIDEIRNRIGQWLSYTGNVFLLSGIDQGKGYTEILSPFEFFGDMTLSSLSEHRDFILVSRKSPEWCSDMYGVDVRGGYADDVSLSDLESLAYLIPGRSVFGGSVVAPELVTVKRFFCRPGVRKIGGNKYEIPNGMYAVVVGDLLVEVNGVPVSGLDDLPEEALLGGLPVTVHGERFIPLTHMKFEERPGTFFGITPLTDVVVKNRQINQLDARTEAIYAASASSPLLMPDTVEIMDMPQYPGAVWKYSSFGPVHREPKRLQGEQVSPSMVEYRRVLVKEIDVLVSAFSAFQGQAPFSGIAGRTVDSLVNQNRERFSGTFREIAAGWKDWATHQLELFRAYGGDKVYKVLGDDGQFLSEPFSAADLGAIDVRVEVNSVIPVSQEAVNSNIDQMIAVGAIDIKNPVSLRKVLSGRGLADFIPPNEEPPADALQGPRERPEPEDLSVEAPPLGVGGFSDDPEGLQAAGVSG